MSAYNHGANYNWSHHGGEWWHHGWNWNRWGWGGIWPYYWFPWFAFDWWPGYYYSIYCPYCYDCGPGYIYADSYAAAPYASAYPPMVDQPSEPRPAEANAPAGGAESTLGDQFLAEARKAFQEGNYRDSLRLGGHAAVEMPRSAEVHNMLMLSMFAGGEYRGAAMEAHAAASLGQPLDWNTVYGFYGNIKPFTDQLRALEKHVSQNASDPAARFLLGYQYLMMGHNDAAKQELTQAVTQAPRDLLAGKLLVQIGGKLPDAVAVVQKQMEQTLQKQGSQVPAPPAPGLVPTGTPAAPTPPSGPPAP
jgi:tetratricopeptide (TPR) repeat protein